MPPKTLNKIGRSMIEVFSPWTHLEYNSLCILPQQDYMLCTYIAVSVPSTLPKSRRYILEAVWPCSEISEPGANLLGRTWDARSFCSSSGNSRKAGKRLNDLYNTAALWPGWEGYHSLTSTLSAIMPLRAQQACAINSSLLWRFLPGPPSGYDVLIFNPLE